jgi:DNA mismatch repair protein MutL
MGSGFGAFGATTGAWATGGGAGAGTWGLGLFDPQAAVLNDLLDDFKKLGFEIEIFGTNTFVVHGSPPDVYSGEEKKVIEKILEHYSHSEDVSSGNKDKLARSFAKCRSIKTGKALERTEMKQIIDHLFECEKPYLGIDGKPCIALFDTEQINQLFK